MVTMFKPRKLGELKPRVREAPSKRDGATERILTRDMGVCRCAECTRSGMLLPAHQVDHRVPLFDGGFESDANRYAINRDCHYEKTTCETSRRKNRQQWHCRCGRCEIAKAG